MRQTVNGHVMDIVSVDEFEQNTGVRFIRNHGGKMKGLWSLSTSCVDNPLCQAYCKHDDFVCSHCFSMFKNLNYKRELRAKCAKNLEVLTSSVLDEFPLLPASVPQRIESFGDTMNVVQATNYILLASANPQCTFALWTKNPQFYREAFAGGLEKPGNLSIVLSSFRLNEEGNAGPWPFVDHTFTVYDPKADGYDQSSINCGARSCKGCMRCYHTKAEPGSEFTIREKLK